MGEKKYGIRDLTELYDYLDERAREYGRQNEVLEGLSVEWAYALGAATLLHELKEAIGPDPREVGIIFIKGEAE